MSWIVFVQAMNLVSCNLTHNVHVLYTHPKTTLISSNAPSDFYFYGSIISSLGIGSFRANGYEMAWIASGIAAFNLALLFPISVTTAIQFSRYLSIFP